MGKIENNECGTELQIRGIEILNGSLNLPAKPQTPVTNFIFNL
ncbi:MAG: hypothetical protein RL713_399, partial [Bacteroidota bacterium]